MKRPGLELEHGHAIGRDPRTMTHDELQALGHERMSPLSVRNKLTALLPLPPSSLAMTLKRDGDSVILFRVLRALRLRCIDCCAGSAIEVRRCTAVECPAWPFRMGTSPWREKRVLTDEERAAFSQRLMERRQKQA